MAEKRKYKKTVPLRILKELQRKRLRIKRIQAEIEKHEKERVILLQKIKNLKDEIEKPYTYKKK